VYISGTAVTRDEQRPLHTRQASILKKDQVAMAHCIHCNSCICGQWPLQDWPYHSMRRMLCYAL